MKVLLVDDHEMVRLGLKSFLSMQTDIEKVLEAKNGQEGGGVGAERKTRRHHHGYCDARAKWNRCDSSHPKRVAGS